MSHPRRFWSTDYSLTALLLFLCLNLFAVQPLGNLGIGGRVLVSVLFSLILVSGVGTVADSRLPRVLVGAVVFTGLTVHWLRLSLGSPALVFWDVGISALFFAILALVVLVQVFSSGPITGHRIRGAIAAYLLIGFACAFGYDLIDLRWPNAFAPEQLPGMNPEDGSVSPFLYFSFVTLTTLGYGDITPVQPIARSLVTMEALAGQLFPAILLARLVSMELFYRQARNAERR